MVNKLNNLGFSEKKQIYCQDWCHLLNNNVVIVIRLFYYKVKVVQKRSYLLVYRAYKI